MEPLHKAGWRRLGSGRGGGAGVGEVERGKGKTAAVRTTAAPSSRCALPSPPRARREPRAASRHPPTHAALHKALGRQATPPRKPPSSSGYGSNSRGRGGSHVVRVLARQGGSRSASAAKGTEVAWLGGGVN